MTLSPCRTLQNVIQTQKWEPCQLNKLSTIHILSYWGLSTRSKEHMWPQFEHHALDNKEFISLLLISTTWFSDRNLLKCRSSYCCCEPCLFCWNSRPFHYLVRKYVVICGQLEELARIHRFFPSVIETMNDSLYENNTIVKRIFTSFRASQYWSHSIYINHSLEHKMKINLRSKWRWRVKFQ